MSGVHVSVHLFVCLCVFVFPHDISKTDAARITKLVIDMVHHESWKPIYFKIKHQCHVTQKHVCVYLQKECKMYVCCWVFRPVWVLGCK